MNFRGTFFKRNGWLYWICISKVDVRKDVWKDFDFLLNFQEQAVLLIFQ